MIKRILILLMLFVLAIHPVFGMQDTEDKTKLPLQPKFVQDASSAQRKEEGHRARIVFKELLPVFESTEKEYEEYFCLNSSQICPMDSLEVNIIKIMHSNKILQKRDWEIIYFSLWSLFNIKGPEFIEKKYGKTIQILKKQWPQFDPTFIIPITEFGFFPNEAAKVFRSVTENHNILIFGASSPDKYLNLQKIYRANVVEGTEPDLLADMNNPAQLKTLPSKHFDTIQIENIPYIDFFNSSFFQTAVRILKDEGELLIPYNPIPFFEDSAKVMKRDLNLPYEVPPNQDYLGMDTPEFFLKNGFQGNLDQRSYYLKDSISNVLFWVLKKSPAEDAGKKKDIF